ncbi:MAG: hypothetical protein KAW19_08090, partial [Candidatus Aminicenantes bacterium]|nr:hypothetical protein [Candidatus Aminicenantes bacterium]
LFGESQSRIVLSCSKNSVHKIRDIAERFGAPFQIIGRTGGKELKILVSKRKIINLSVEGMFERWIDSLQSLIMA